MNKAANKAATKDDEDGLVKFSISVPAELVEKLDAYARAAMRSRSNAVAVILAERLSDAKGGAA